MKLLIFYTVWTFICSFFLRVGLNLILDENLGYWPALYITVFVQLCVVFPLGAVISSAGDE
jgi:hypothetical protein